MALHVHCIDDVFYIAYMACLETMSPINFSSIEYRLSESVLMDASGRE